ncbi:hypothetical protein RFN25_28090 [Mesorhizobium abyssinicae]|uniref:hypothetical protein n=1 Tax=Mesorhizobium abyssinicae TaxID=1209958 RepID=UPI002A24CDF3|nr:hypothetical protein [Mesorhizobium abyssinicae]MDX8437271.1 hypothetical protein [Mesorhizobium abyssinicae]
MAKQNRRRARLVDDERRALQPLPPKADDFILVSAHVARNSTISVDRITYSLRHDDAMVVTQDHGKVSLSSQTAKQRWTSFRDQRSQSALKAVAPGIRPC